jgi:hypothetical protein
MDLRLGGNLLVRGAVMPGRKSLREAPLGAFVSRNNDIDAAD